MKTGVYVPLITPYNADMSIDYEGLAKATRFVLDKGADGIYACGSTGEFFLMSTEERKRCLEVIVANAGDKEVIAHVGSTSTREAVELAKHAEKVGATMLSAVAPYYMNYGFPEVKAYFQAIAHATSLNLMIYSAAQARSYTLEEMRELLEDEKITAVKYTGYNFYMLERLIQYCPDKKFYTGADETFLSGAIIGSHGAIGTTYNYFADKYIEARRLFKENKNEEALKIINVLNATTESLLASGSALAATKYLMSLQGLDILPLAREPYAPLSEEVKSQLKKVYDNAFND